MKQLDDEDQKLITLASNFLKKEYKANKHHVACVMQGDRGNYYALHIDSKGFDVCAEPIALYQALANGDDQIAKVVSVLRISEDNIKVVSPCGNCRQILLEYAPKAEIIVAKDGNNLRAAPKELLPAAYQ